VAHLNQLLSGWLNRFSSEICAKQSREVARASATNAGAKPIEDLERRLLMSAISGQVYNDINDNGLLDTGEAGIAGVTVYVDVGDTHSYVITDPHTTTDVNGNYSIGSLADGNYIIRQIPPTGALQTDPTGNAGQHETIAGADVTGANFGDFTPSTVFSISGTVYNDTNDDGTLDNGEHGIAGVTVYIDANDDHILENTELHTTTDANGNYSFASLTPGIYILRQVQPNGTQQTEPTGNAGNHVLLSTFSQEAVNFGDFKPDGAVFSASMNEITGYAFDPTNLSTTVDVEIVISGGPTQEILANQTNASLQSIIGSTTHGFTYDTPVLSAGSHTVQIFALNPNTSVMNLLATETLVSQNSLFDEHYYLATNPDVAAAVAAGKFGSGYDHYVQYGQFEGRSPSPYWDEAYYLQENPDVEAAVRAGTISSGFMHYYLYGQYENRQGLLYYNNTYYLENNVDVAAAVSAHTIASGFEHFVLYGQYEGRAPMLYFSSVVYDAHNPDILSFVTGEGFSSDFEHFVLFGQFEDRIASNFYNERTYLADNPDVAAAVMAGDFKDGLEHWLEYGQFEGRRAV